MKYTVKIIGITCFVCLSLSACGKNQEKPVSQSLFLLLLVFQGKISFASWFLLLFAVKVTTAFNSLTRPERVKVLILDDFVIKRNRSKAVELLARVYDHVEHKYQKGFALLTLGWSDGYIFIPTGFNILSSTKESNRYLKISDKINHHTNGYKARKESIMHKTDAAVLLMKNALDASVQADYVLMDICLLPSQC